MMFSLTPLLFIMPLVLSKCCLSHVCSLLIGQRGRVKHRDTALVSLVLYHSLPPPSLVPFCVLFPVHQTIVDNKLLCQQREQCCCCCCCFFYVVEGCCQSRNSITYSKRLPDVSFWSPACCVGVACHRLLVSPQWLATLSRRLLTDRCWLTNQQLSTTNLCCGPSRLTGFCVTVIEL